jgi:putative lysine transport system substrate-binding protein
MAVSNGVADVCIVDVPTAQSALLTNDDLEIITLSEDDTFSGHEEMVNVCIATRKDDTELRDGLQEAMDALGWDDKSAMDKLMERVIDQQPAAN